MKKSTKILIALVLLNLFLGGLLLTRESSSPIYDLIDPNTRLKAYKDLLEQNQLELPFSDDLPSLLIRKIPVKDYPLHPLYLILWDFRFHRPVNDFPGEKFGESGHTTLTPPLELPTADPTPAEYVISLVSHDGRLLDKEKPRPFGGYNLLDEGEVIFDINQDGQVDWVSTRSHSQNNSRTSLNVVQIAKMSHKAEVQFRVAVFSRRSLITSRPKGDLANEADWSFQCADVNSDGLLDLQIGPGTSGSIVPKVTFYWNPDTETYESPSGMMSPYFYVLPTAPPWRVGELLHPFDK